MRDILLFAGLSASGKSTIASCISHDGPFELISERRILHTLALRRGFNRTREWLAREGIAAVLEAARTETVQLIKSIKEEGGVVIDGSYDYKLPGSIKQAFPSTRLTLISITLDQDLREERMRLRLGKTFEEAQRELALIDGFKLAAGIEEIIKQADISVDNSTTLEQSVKFLQDELATRGIGNFTRTERK